MSKMPVNIEELRTKYKVMANMFLLAKMRQPSRTLCRDLEVHTFSDFLDELLSDQNFLMESDDDDHLVIPLGTSASTTSTTSEQMQFVLVWKKGSPSKTPSGTHFRTKSTGCSTGSSSFPSPVHASTLRGYRSWNNVYQYWKNRDAEEEEKAEEKEIQKGTSRIRILQHPLLRVSEIFRLYSN